MKKIPLLLITLMATVAYSGGPADSGDDALSDREFVELISRPDADAAIHDLAAFSAVAEAAAPAEDGSPPPEEQRDNRQPSVEPVSFNLCLYLQSLREKTAATAQEQWQKLPTVKCPCVKRRLRKLKQQGGELTDEAAAVLMRLWNTVQTYRGEPASLDELDDNDRLAHFEAQLKERDATIKKLQAQLAALQDKN